MSLIFLQGLAWVSREPKRRESPVLAQTAVPSSKAVTHGPLSGNGAESRAADRQSRLTSRAPFGSFEDRRLAPIR